MEQMYMHLLMSVLILISSHLIDFVFEKEKVEVGQVPDELVDCLEHLTLTENYRMGVGIPEGQRRSVFGLYPDQLFQTD